MRRNTWKYALSGAATALVVAATCSASAVQTIRFATIAPRTSTWGKVLVAWEKAIREKTNGEIDLTIYYDGVQGEERNVVAKMKTGQLDAAALSSIGLSHIYHDVMVLQLPGVTNSWPLADLVRNMLKDPIEQ